MIKKLKKNYLDKFLFILCVTAIIGAISGAVVSIYYNAPFDSCLCDLLKRIFQ